MLSKTLQLGAAGNAGGGKVYVDDVFSCFLYEGNDSTQTITNGIDLSGEGGLVWTKPRTTCDSFNDHIFVDSERGDFFLKGNETDANNAIASFNFASTGYTVPNNARVNDGTDQFGNAEKYVSWTFRKAPGFFDVVTYTGNGTAGRIVSHSLGSVPGMIWVKKTSGTGSWMVYHRSTGNSNAMLLQQDDAAFSSPVFNNTTPTSTEFTLNNGGAVNGNGSTYVAYVFAHDDQSFGTDSDEAIIKCDGYTGNGTSGHEINLGFEPQWLMIKRASGGSQNWFMFDSMRGIATGGIDGMLRADSTADEQVSNDTVDLTPTGFKIINTNSVANKSGDSYVYMAIRRPHKPPEAGTDVFNNVAYSGTGASSRYISGAGFPPDFSLTQLRNNNLGNANHIYDRLRGNNKRLRSQGTNGETGNNGIFEQDGITLANSDQNNLSSYNYINYFFRRAPGFMDVVAYTGTGSARAVSHNLTVKPELIITKARNYSDGWGVQAGPLGATKRIRLDLVNAASTNSGYWNNTEPTSSVFTVGTDNATNGNTYNYIAYLFASLDGISKVGSYSGTGNNLSVNCGFAAGARFVLIKRTDSSGDWWLFDTTRGIVSSGNDPALRLNLTNAEVTSTDYLEPNSNGFTVTSTAGAGLNANGGTYIYLAIA